MKQRFVEYLSIYPNCITMDVDAEICDKIVYFIEEILLHEFDEILFQEDLKNMDEFTARFRIILDYYLKHKRPRTPPIKIQGNTY